MESLRLFAATGESAARIDTNTGKPPTVTYGLEGQGVESVAVDPQNPDRVFAGTFDRGVFKSLGGGETWSASEGEIPHPRVMSIEISPSHRENGQSVVYAGTEPSNLFRSEDDGESWIGSPALPALPSAKSWAFPPRPWTHHARWIALHATDPKIIYVGIELGGVMRSLDGGETWEDRKPGAYTDSHAVKVHISDPDRVYEAAGQGIAMSSDRGASWSPADDGMDRHYGWGLAIDPLDPSTWYVSASTNAGHAHHWYFVSRSGGGDARAYIYRKNGDAPWQPVTGQLAYMPYALLTLRNQPGVLIAGMQHGEITYTEDYGESWQSLDLKLPSLLQLSAANGL